MNTLTQNSMQKFSDALLNQYIEMIPTLIAGVSIFIVFMFAAIVARAVVRRVFSRLTNYVPLVDLAARITYLTLIIIGVITALGTAGVNVSALVASLGLFGFTLGFAFKDLLSNTLAGVMILFYRPFKIGDTISGTDFEGKVQEINLRYVILRNQDHRILIPNATMLSNIVNVHN